MISCSIPKDFASWRQQARQLIQAAIPPEQVVWRDPVRKGDGRLELEEEPADPLPPPSPGAKPFHVPKDFLEKAERVFYHRSERKWTGLYRLLWRILHQNRRLLDDGVDEDVRQFMDFEHQVRRDAHKMKAFVRFRHLPGDDVYIAWHQPDHPLLPYVVPFFQDRFASIRWTLLTPDASAHWDGQTIQWGRGFRQDEAPAADQLEDLWACYYASIFNPARVKLKAMKAEMPARYWKSMPETRQIARLLEESEQRVAAMIEQSPRDAAAFVPENADFPTLRDAARGCRACALCEPATQTVFGEGPLQARIMIIGEQPGDQEDREGQPFVGPAGQVLNQALMAAGIDRSLVYVTNAVKHFKFTNEGGRRLHDRPSARDVAACKPWLMAERRLLQVDAVICLGLTAGLSVFGRSFRLMDVRGVLQASRFSQRTMITHHPAHILRLPEAPDQDRAFAELVNDLRLVHQAVG